MTNVGWKHRENWDVLHRLKEKGQSFNLKEYQNSNWLKYALSHVIPEVAHHNFSSLFSYTPQININQKNMEVAYRQQQKYVILLKQKRLYLKWQIFPQFTGQFTHMFPRIRRKSLFRERFE